MDPKALLTKFAAFAHANRGKADAEIVDLFIATLPTDGAGPCSHCGSHDVKEADFKDRPLSKAEIKACMRDGLPQVNNERGPAWLCSCGYWTHRKVGLDSGGFQ